MNRHKITEKESCNSAAAAAVQQCLWLDSIYTLCFMPGGMLSGSSFNLPLTTRSSHSLIQAPKRC